MEATPLRVFVVENDQDTRTYFAPMTGGQIKQALAEAAAELRAPRA